MKILLVIFALLKLGNSLANVGDYIASSASTMGLAGQANFKPDDAANNHYVGAMQAFNEKTFYSINMIAVQGQFAPINDVVVKSPVNSEITTDEYGDLDPNYGVQNQMALHASFPFLKRFQTKLNLSAFMPMDKMLEVSTGDPYRPEYIMYRSRMQRMLMQINLAKSWNDYAFSVGGMSGMQSNGETYIVARENGSGNPPSSGKMSFNARPSMALTFSMLKKNQDSQFYFAFQDEMKNKFFNHASGMTPIGASSLKYDWDLESMLYYDPRIFRTGTLFHQGKINWIFGLEYQDWSGHESSILSMKNNGGILQGTVTQQNYSLQNIWIPKIAAQVDFATYQLDFGLSHRKSPLVLKEGASGNSLDLDATIISMGYQKPLPFFEQDFSFSMATQWHYLHPKTVTKEDGREDGTSGAKIGGPSYKAEGQVFAVSFGLSWVL
jgi:hypothetical protein